MRALDAILLAMGCNYGQEIITQIHEVTEGWIRKKKATFLYVYDAKTERLIGRRRAEQ